MRTVLAVFLLAAALCLPAFGQTLGEIVGTATDSTGAVVPSAAITVTNTSTNAVRKTVSNEAGIYSLPGLVPGPYSVRIEKEGFRAMTRTLTVQVQQTARVDFALQVGQVSETVEVSASSQMLTTENATIGTVIEERRIMDLPLNGRNFFSLVALSPNVTYGFTPAAQASGRLGGTRASLTIALSGSRSTWQNYTLDGITNTDINFNTYILQPSVDSLQEFKVQTGVYPAEFGRAAGQVNVSTKSGTNQYHGTMSEFLRNDKLDARDYDFSSASRSATNPSPGKTPYRQNQYGYTLGGPVQIPKVFNGKNRLFFMSNWEGYNSRRTTTGFAGVLTPEMRNGDFSSILPGFKLADPTSRAGTYPNITQTFFPNNQIPASSLSAGSKLLASRWMPRPNQLTAAGSLPFRNYQFSQRNPVDKNTITERIDFNESSSSQWFGRYSWNDESAFAVLPSMGLDDGNVLYTRASQWVVSNVRTISPTKVNEARFGYNSLFNNITQQLANKEDVNALLGTPIKVTDPNSWGIPNINFQTQNLTTFGNPTSSPFQIDNKYYQFVDNFSWIIGKHSLRMGGEYRYNKFPQVGNEFPRGQFYFNNQFTNAITPTGPTTATQSGGYVGGDFMLGDTNNAIAAVSLVQADFRSSEWAAYIDDSWKVTPRLTLSLGFRWEVAQPMFDALGKEPNVQINMPLPNVANVQDQSKHPVYVRTGSGDFYDGIAFRYTSYYNSAGAARPVGTLYPLQTVRDGRLGKRLINTNYRDFAPRIGIAWSPSDKWSVRTGFGIFYSMESKNSIFDLSRGMGGRTGAVTPTTYGVPFFSYTNFINTASLPVTLPVGLTWGGNSHLPDSSTMTFVLNVQRTLGKASTLEVGYSGGLHRHLQYLTNMNQGILSASLPVAQRLPYPEWGASGIQWINADGMGSYHGLAGKFTQRLGTNLSTLLSYTWSKALDTASNIRGPGNDFSPQDARCPNSCEKGPSAFHVPQRFVASILYTLPFGKGQKFLNHGGVVNQVVGGWQLSTITTLQSGGVVNTGSWDSGGTLFITNATRLNCIAGVDPVLPNHNQNGWFNPAAFSNTLPGTFGNCGRNTLRGPWRGTQDISVVKLFPIAERKSLEFRTEMFNAPNHVILGNPGAGWGSGASPTPSATFGRITGTATSMRQIQFALKFNF
ncbi:MAG: TonB-dependent receptor [Bryobacterales bacterium]|nr:TonB-dependent receptor [Bryobacterales bacterium]